MSKGMRPPSGDEEDRTEAGRAANSKKKRGGPRHVEDEGVFRLRVTLDEIEPPIYRRLLVPAEMRLDELSQVLLDAMGWEGGHLHRFLQGALSYSNTEFELEEAEDESKYSLGEIVSKEDDKFEFEYDFGDGWVHKVVVEQLCPTEDGVHYPVCLDGARACPPEDCGGVGGYDELVAAMAEPRHPRRKEWLESLGGKAFEADTFDLKEINDRLRRLG